MKKENVKEKTQIYNVVILDKSGSMGSIKSAAVEGFNETLVGIKKAQEKFAETQQHYLSLVAFCGCEMKVLYDKVPISEAKLLDMNDYQPCCSTPLFDAMGFTLTDIRKHVKELKDAMVVVTIITDGMENASKEYSGEAVKSLVDELRHEGWTFPIWEPTRMLLRWQCRYPFAMPETLIIRQKVRKRPWPKTAVPV